MNSLHEMQRAALTINSESAAEDDGPYGSGIPSYESMGYEDVHTTSSPRRSPRTAPTRGSGVGRSSSCIVAFSEVPGIPGRRRG